MSRRRASVVIRVLAGLYLACGAAWSLEPKDTGSYLDQKELFKPELYISSSQVSLEEALPALPNRKAWEGFLEARASSAQPSFRAFIDPRSGTAVSLIGAFPLIPGRGAGNQVTLEDVAHRIGRGVSAVDGKTVAEAVRSFVLEHGPLLGIDAAQLGEVRAVTVNPSLWQVSIPQTYQGIPVRHGRVVASISHGNVVVFGTETWGDVRGLSPRAKLTAEEALQAGFGHAGGRSAVDEILREPALEVIPVAPPEHQRGEAFAGPAGAGYRHRLAWTFVFRRPPDDASWEILVDAHSGEVLAFQDINHYVNKQITGGVYPLTGTEICPDAATCGTMQSGWPMPFADTGLPAPNDFTNSAGIFNYGGGTVTTTLTGRYVGIVDVCGATANSSATGDLNLGGINGQHDCASAGGSPGNTASSRSAFYEVNKVAEQARGWLPSNPWLQSRLTANVNRIPPPFCNAFYTPGDGAIHFYRSGGGCRNTGELAGVFDHEWGHGLDDNDANGVLSSSSEGYADIAAIYRLQTSCIGHGFWWTADKSCGQTADGTGFNANEAQLGAAHCDLNCSGVRDADWDRHADHTPDTALGFVCSSCSSGSGPCGRQTHCAAAPSRQAAWDLVARDLRGAPFNYDSQTAFLIGNKLFYQGSGNIGQWHSCSCGVSSDGCGATNAYMQWLTADDDNGNLNDGTPHMTAIYDAFNRHGIACPAPSPQNSGCSGGPAAAPTLSAILGDHQSALSWNATPGATRYWVFRTEGHAGCDSGKALIAETTGTAFTDSQVANGRSYRYNVVAAGSSPACFSPASNCATPIPPLKDADVLSQSVPSSMVAGQSYSASVTLKNVGNVAWSPVGPQCNAYRLASIDPIWVPSIVDLPAPVPPGGEVTLAFTVTAPSTPGTYNFQWRMVHHCVEWFGDATPNVPVNVQALAASFTYACTGIACTFDASGSSAGQGIASYSWTFGDSGVGVGKTPAHTYSISGQYPVTLTITDTAGASASTTQNLLLVFADVPLNHWARKFIEAIYYQGVTAGCAANPLRFCPDAQLTRAEIAVFLLRAKLGNGYQPPPATCSPLQFPDVPCTHWAAAWIEELARRGLTAGCGGGNYCPDGLVDRSQVAVFLIRTLLGTDYVPPPVDCSAPRFSDVPCTHWAAVWIEDLARRGITAGCGPNIYCPADIVSRGMMAVFLVTTFNFSTAQKDVQVLSQSVPPAMTAGQSHAVSMTLKNVGSRTWDLVGPQCNAYRLGTVTGTSWGPARVELPAVLPPGQAVTLNFTVTAPSTRGTYDFQWRMVHECVEWFGEPSPNVPVTVTRPKDAQVLSQSVPATMVAGQSYAVSMTLKNVGSLSWSPVGPQCNAYRLGTVTSTSWGPVRVELPAAVAPGQTVTLNFTVTAPGAPGTYPFQWRMVHECVEWLGDLSPQVNVSVVP